MSIMRDLQKWLDAEKAAKQQQQAPAVQSQAKSGFDPTWLFLGGIAVIVLFMRR